MRFIMKHLSKKTLSVILALMVVLSTVAVAFSAIAVSDPFVVTLARPALQMQVGKTIDLNKISVQFSDTETVAGDAIKWTASPGVLLDSAGYVTAMSTGTYKLTATKASDASVARTFYLFVKDAIEKDLVIYDHSFSTSELVTPAGQSYKKFADSSEWDVVNFTTPGDYASLSLGTMYNWPGVGATGNVNAAFFIKPDSDAGKLISAFPDITIDVKGINYSNARGGWSGAFMRANLGDNNTFDISDAHIMARVMSTNTDYNATENSISRIFQSSGSHISSTTISTRLERQTHQYRRYVLEGDKITASLDKNKNGTFTDVASHTYSGLNVTNGGTIGFYSDNASRTIIDYFKVKITFTEAELAAIENSYTTNNYYFVNQNQPAIPVELNKKVSLSNVVVEFPDGSFMMGTDVIWENNNGAISYDEAADTFSVYAEGMFTVKAKKDAADAGTEVILITPNSDGKYIIYDHTFTANDINAAGNDFVADSEWDLVPYTTIADGQFVVSGQGVTAGNNHVNLVLKPTSASGKLVSTFRDITVNAEVSFSTWFGQYGSNFTLGSRAQFANNTPAYSATTYVGGGYRVALTPQTSDAGEKDFAITYVSGKAKKVEFDEANNAFSEWRTYTLKTVGNSVELYRNGVKADLPMTADQQTNIANTQGGTVFFTSTKESRAILRRINVGLEFADSELAKLQLSDVDPLYNLTNDYPAVPMKKATKLDLSKLLVELPDGNFIMGDNLDWSCDFIGSDFFVDNTEKAVYAYGEGRYDVKVKHNGTDVMTAHFVVADDNGNYKIFDHTFTEADLTALGATGKSDMWISYFSNKVTPLKDYAKNKGDGNATFEEGKGISLYGNSNHVLVLNPEHPDAKVISKFKNQIIDFTGSKRTANNQGYAWTQAGQLGAIGRINLGANNEFDLQFGNYYTTDNPELDHHILGAFHDTSALIYVDTTEGFVQNSTLRTSYYYRSKSDCASFNQSYMVDGAVTHNFRIQLNETDITLSVAPEGTASYTKLYSSLEDTTLEDRKKAMLPTANKKAGTIALYSSSNSRGYFSHVSVSISFDALPELVSLGECRDEDSRVIYLQVGQTLDLTKINFESGDRYFNGAALTFSNVPTGLTVVDGVSITPTAEGVHTVTANAAGTTFELVIAVSAAGSLFDNGNYTLTQSAGVITDYPRADATKPFSQYVLFKNELDGQYIYEIAPGLAGKNSGANKQLVEVEFEKYIEKIGGGAFTGAVNLKSIKLPNTMVSIGASAFSGATALEDLFLPGSVEVIGDKAFEGDSALRVVIANKDAEIGEKAFTSGATIVGFAGSTAESYATANGLTFEALAGEERTKAEASYNEWTQWKANRLTKVDTDVEWVIHRQNDFGAISYYINGFKPGNRDAGKYVIPATVEYNGEKVKIVGVRANAFDSIPDGRAIYTLEFEEGITAINFYGFRNCYNIQSVKFPESMSGIGWFSFANCTSLTTVDIPAGVNALGPKAFDNCSNLETVNIPVENSILSAFGTHSVRTEESPEGVFNGTKVKVVKLPVTVNRLTSHSFTQSAVKELWVYNKDLSFVDTYPNDNKDGYVLPAGMVIYGVKGSTAEEYATKWGHEFHEIPDFYKEQDGVLDSSGKFHAALSANGYYTVGRFVGVGGKVIMPSAINVGDVKNAPITVISSTSFQFEGVPTNGIDRIMQLEISEGYVAIEDEAFKNADHLKSVKLPNTLRTIGKMAFTGTGLEGTVEIPKSTTQIGAAAFRGVPGVKDIYIYNPAATIGSTAFDEGVTIHGVKNSTAHTYALENNLKFVEIESSKATAGDFSDNGNYTFTIDANGVITGYERKDENKPYSLKVAIPATIGGVKVTGIGEGVFEAGAEKSSVYAVTIAEGITSIGKNAFNGMSNLSYVSIPKSLKTIGEAAFVGTSLTGDFVLHEGLETVEREAFKGCYDIDSFTAESKTVVLKANCLPRGSQKTVLYGYTGSTAEEFAKAFNFPFEYLDGGPEEPGDKEPGDTDKDPNNSKDPIDGPGDIGNEGNDIITVLRQNDMTLVIVIAVSVLLLVVLIAVAVVVVVVIKTKRDSIY